MPDLFDIFKENEENLHELPSDKAWQKLQVRLEKSRKRKQRKIRFLQLGAVVLILLILLTAAYIVLSIGK
jgi:archaellum biogenesis protein FlaJ (TadC family)